MGFLEKRKSRRIRGAEFVVTGGITMFLAKVVSWLAPAGFGLYGLYRIFIKKSYKDGIVSLAVAILLLTLFKGAFDIFLMVAMASGGFLLGLGAVLMILPSKKNKEIEIKAE